MKNKTNRTILIVLIIIFFIYIFVFATYNLGIYGDSIKDLWLMFFYTIFNAWAIGNIIAVKYKTWIKLLMFVIFELLPVAIYGVILLIF